MGTNSFFQKPEINLKKLLKCSKRNVNNWTSFQFFGNMFIHFAISPAPETTKLLRKHFHWNISFFDPQIEGMPKNVKTFEFLWWCSILFSEKTRFNYSIQVSQTKIIYLHNCFPVNNQWYFSLHQNPYNPNFPAKVTPMCKNLQTAHLWSRSQWEIFHQQSNIQIKNNRFDAGLDFLIFRKTPKKILVSIYPDNQTHFLYSYRLHFIHQGLIRTISAFRKSLRWKNFSFVCPFEFLIVQNFWKSMEIVSSWYLNSCFFGKNGFPLL